MEAIWIDYIFKFYWFLLFSFAEKSYSRCATRQPVEFGSSRKLYVFHTRHVCKLWFFILF